MFLLSVNFPAETCEINDFTVILLIYFVWLFVKMNFPLEITYCFN